MLADLLKPLQALKWDYEGDIRGWMQCRQAMLILCEEMLRALENIAPAERFNYYKGVGYLIRRLEHGGSFLAGELQDVDFNPTGEELALCLHYRGLLFESLKQTAASLAVPSATANLTEKSSTMLSTELGQPMDAMDGVPTPSAMTSPTPQAPAVLQAFCAQLLAVLSFRAPDLMTLMLRKCLQVSQQDLTDLHEDMTYALDMIERQQEEEARRDGGGLNSNNHPHKMRHSGSGSPEDHLNKRNMLSAAGGPRHGKLPSDKRTDVANYFLQSFEESGLQVSAEIGHRLPGLFEWRNFHAQLAQLDTTKRSVQLVMEEMGDQWLTKTITRSSPMFHLFFKYWIEHAVLVQDGMGVIPHVSFRDITPFRSLTRAFLVSFAESQERPRTMSDCAVALLSVEPQLVSFLFKTLFISTNASDFLAVLDALMQVELWLKQLIADGNSLGENFDYDFMCTGFDRILSMEHHVVTARLLSLIYNHSQVFTGDGRVKLFGNLLMGKYGYMLFLSWDVNTRSIFQQLLVFKLLRMTRKQLQSPPPTPTPKVFDQDRLLLSKQEALVRTVKQQAEEKDPSLKREYDPHWETYVPKALEDFNLWMNKYNDNPEEPHKLQVVAKAPAFKA